MDLDTFFMIAEGIAIRYDLRLMIQRQPVGCGFQFYFVDGDSKQYSIARTYLPGHRRPEEFLSELDILAKGFKEEL